MKTKTEFQTKPFDTDLEKKIKSYYSSYKGEPSFKQKLQNQLRFEISQKPVGKQQTPPFNMMFTNPKAKWGIEIFAFVFLCILSLAITPVREALGKAIDLGYLEGVGFVRISETRILNGTVISDHLSQAVVIDQVVMDSEETTIWLHATGEQFLTQSTNGEPIAYLEAEGQQIPTSSWGWVDDTQSGVLRFSASTPSIPLAFYLHIAPDWNIPIQLIPMSESTDGQAVTLFSDQCQTHKEVGLCVQAFISDSAGYHLLLNASSSNSDFYFETPFLSNRLTGEDVQLVDSFGHHLQTSSASNPDFPIPFEIPVEVFDSQREASTTLNYSPSTQEGDFLTLIIPGLTVKTPANQTITCTLENDLVIGSTFPCEASVTIGGNELTFHSGEVLQGQTGIQLRITSDPVYLVDNLILTGVDFEIADGNAPLIGTSFEVKTQQLSLFMERDAISSDQPFNIQITTGYLTILEPFQFTWEIEP